LRKDRKESIRVRTSRRADPTPVEGGREETGEGFNGVEQEWLPDASGDSCEHKEVWAEE
jgi:hypothetical protein